MKPLNLLITNYCNQTCSFCFAKKEMSNKTITGNMSHSNFKKLISLMPRDSQSVKSLKILGGEPTLHPQISNLITTGLRKFQQIQIFTNGIFSNKLCQSFQSFVPRLSFTFNIMTPGFLYNMKTKKIVTENIIKLSKKTEVALSLTIDPNTVSEYLMHLIPKVILNNINHYRIGLSNPIADQKNYYFFSDFPKIGNNLSLLVDLIIKVNHKSKFLLNCGFTRCMFSRKQLDKLKKNGVELNGWGCFGKSSSMDVNPDLRAFHCFPLSTIKREKVVSSPIKNNSNFLNDRYIFWRKYESQICHKCPSYGHTPYKCPGPCIAFRMNNRNDSNWYPKKLNTLPK